MLTYKMSTKQFNQYLADFKKDYIIFAPTLLQGKGAFTDTDTVRYQEIQAIEDVEYAKKSDFSIKEILTPITQTLFYFSEDNWVEPKIHDKKILLFMRSCDIHGLKRLDDIYLNNGCEDPYYKKIREKVKICVMECAESFENCFCVSMNTNATEEYDLFVRRDGDDVYVNMKNGEFPMTGEEVAGISPRFITENQSEVAIPQNISAEIAQGNIWEEYSSRCIGCGRCSFVCPTCSCFSMQDIFYKENQNMGERRRVWASCMVDGFSDMAGGHAFRKKQGERMRFRVMHKFHDYKKRFGYHMCVGCGRCDDACPEYISIGHCVNRVHQVMEEQK